MTNRTLRLACTVGALFLTCFCLSCDKVDRIDSDSGNVEVYVEGPEEERAINIVKAAKTKDVWPDLAEQSLQRFDTSDTATVAHRIARMLWMQQKDTETVEDMILDQMKRLTGRFEVQGWRARQVGESTFLVTYTYTTDSGVFDWAYEVKPPIGLVRSIRSDPELKEYYEQLLIP